MGAFSMADMPKKNPLTTQALSDLKENLHDTAMSMFVTRQRLQRYLKQDSELVQRARKFYVDYSHFADECLATLEPKVVPKRASK